MFNHLSKPVFVALAIVLSACSGGSEGTGVTSREPDLKGVISAPGGAIAFNNLGLWQQMFAGIFGKNALAAITGVARVGAGVTVILIEVDSQGNQTGEILATGTTNSAGEFSIDTPVDFTAGSQYVIRATGASEIMDARVFGNVVDINPVSDAASQLVTNNVTDLNEISTAELKEFVTTVAVISHNIDPAGLSAQSLSSAMQTEAVNYDESINVINSASATGQICGTVTNADSTGLGNIRIIARDYGDWVTRAKTKTESDGSYCLNLPIAGDPDTDTGNPFSGAYILGAINKTGNITDPNRSASEWWSADGTAYSQFTGEKISVTDSTPVIRDFRLENGVSISGSVSDAGTGGNIEGIKVTLRNFQGRAPVASTYTKADGSYQLNVIEGSYSVETRNTTAKNYASEVYDGANGSNNNNRGIPVSLTTGLTETINFELVAGYQLSGVITDGIGGSPVTGRRLMVNLFSGGPAVRLRTNKQGYYRVWLRPDNYYIYAYGQASGQITLSSSQTVNFESPNVSSITATVTHNNLPVSQAKVRLYNSAGTFTGMEPTSSNGTVTVFSASTGDHFIEVRVDRQADYGTIIYNNNTRLMSGQAITIPTVASTLAIDNIPLPNAGLLTGTITSNGTTPIANFKLDVRDDNDLAGANNGTSSTDRFTLMRTRGDGSFVVSLPPGIYDRVKMIGASLTTVNDNANCDSITIMEGMTTTINYNNATDTCF